MANKEQGQGLPQQISDSINKLRSKIAPSENDRVWSEYMDERRDWRELTALALDKDVQPEFQKKAIEILLAPEISKLPFPVNVDTMFNTFVDTSKGLIVGVTAEQAGFIAKKIPEYIKHAEQMAKWESTESAGKNALWAYNNMIPQLLGKLPQKQAEQLFELFSLNDVFPFWGMDESSGYNPLKSLYYYRNINESWKRKAAAKMHEIIELEQSGVTMPREEHEGAAKNYSYILNMMAIGDERLPISNSFYQDEIEFMLCVETGEPIIESWNTRKVLGFLDDPELRHKFVRRQVLSGKPESLKSFSVYNEEGAETANKIISEFYDDKDLVIYLENELVKYINRSVDDKKIKEEKARKEQNILQKMKK